MGQFVDLLKDLPKARRNISARREGKTAEDVEVAREFEEDYFDGDRRFGYGGYEYDGRWRSVVRAAKRHYNLKFGCRVLDVGCAKGFLVKDFTDAGAEAFGVDVSEYATIKAPHPDVVGRLHYIDVAAGLPFPDRSFDLVLSINTLHNLSRDDIIQALQEIQRVSRGSAFVVVDSYRTPAEEQAFRDWVLTAEYAGTPDEWLSLFAEAGYDGDYAWTIIEAEPESEGRRDFTVAEALALDKTKRAEVEAAVEGAKPREDLDARLRSNWDSLPEEQRRACLDHLRSKIPSDILEVMWAQHAAGKRIGSHLFGFVRNELRSVLLDTQLPPAEGTQMVEPNWDEYYTGALEALAEEASE